MLTPRLSPRRAVALAVFASACASGAPAIDAAPETFTPLLVSAVPENGYLPVVERISDRVHVVRQAVPNFAGVVGNVTIIEQDDSIVLVDSGVAHGWGARVVEAVRRISAKPVSAVIITHWHGDHPLGVTAIREAWPDVEIIATAATRERISTEANGAPPVPKEHRDLDYEARRIETLEGYRGGTIAALAADAQSDEERAGWARAEASLPVRIADVPGTYAILPTRTFTDSLTLPDDVTPIEVRFEGRANTEGDAVVWLPRERILVAGDLVVAPIPYMFNIYPEENVRTLERLRGYDPRLIIPGHGEPLHGTAYLQQLIAFMSDVRTQTSALAQRGLSVEDATAQIQLEPFADAFAGDDPWLRVWFRDYAATPLIESAYREARGEALGPPPP
jgi:glyoxylase-like metal-dependent hydrolase (beta-lactamase superfamily II)